VGGVVLLVDAPSCLILAAAALALFPRKRFRMSSLKDMRRVYMQYLRRKKGIYHATLTLKRCKTERPALFRQLVEVMLYALRRKFPIFHDTVRVQDAVFESGQERIAVVGHRVWFIIKSARRAERSSRPILLPTLPWPMFRGSDRDYDQSRSPMFP
jgi:hypothetical protein